LVSCSGKRARKASSSVNHMHAESLRLGTGGEQAKLVSGRIPTELALLTRLKILELHAMQVVGTCPTEIGALTQLEQLVLAQNRLSGQIPSELGKLINLVQLDLSYNFLTGSLPPELLNLNRLQILSVSNNELKVGNVLPELRNFTDLRKAVRTQLSGGDSNKTYPRCQRLLKWPNRE